MCLFCRVWAPCFNLVSETWTMLRSHGDDESEIPRAPGDTNAEASHVSSFIASARVCTEYGRFYQQRNKKLGHKKKQRRPNPWAKERRGNWKLGLQKVTALPMGPGLNQSQLVVHVLFCVCTSEEQLAQKKASKEVRTEVLEQLKAINCFCTTSHGPGSWLIWLFAFCICFLIVIVVQPDDNSCRQFQHVMFLILNVASAWQSLRSN